MVLLPTEFEYMENDPVPPVIVFDKVPIRLEVLSVKVITQLPVKAPPSSPNKETEILNIKFIDGVVVDAVKEIVFT